MGKISTGARKIRLMYSTSWPERDLFKTNTCFFFFFEEGENRKKVRRKHNLNASLLEPLGGRYVLVNRKREPSIRWSRWFPGKRSAEMAIIGIFSHQTSPPVFGFHSSARFEHMFSSLACVFLPFDNETLTGSG